MMRATAFGVTKKIELAAPQQCSLLGVGTDPDTTSAEQLDARSMRRRHDAAGEAARSEGAKTTPRVDILNLPQIIIMIHHFLANAPKDLVNLGKSGATSSLRAQNLGANKVIGS